mgnify:CR=1 FL=1
MESCDREKAQFNLSYEGNMCKNTRYVNFGAAVSGGSDSMTLLMLLHRFLQKHGNWFKKNLNYRPKLTALHVDHSVREESSREAQEVRQYIVSKGEDHSLIY